MAFRDSMVSCCLLSKRLLVPPNAHSGNTLRSSNPRSSLVAMQCCGYLNGAAAWLPRHIAWRQSPGNSCASLRLPRWHRTPTSSCDRFAEIPYMGDVDAFEEREPPAMYVPPPEIDAAALDMRNKVERLLYMLQEILPGPASEEKYEAVFDLIDEDVEFQDPLLCFRGCQGLRIMLQAFVAGGANLDLHEIYYESIATDPSKRWIYATWTIIFTRNGTALSMSGESKLDMNQSGKVRCIVSKWYQLNDQAENDLIASKIGISAMLSKATI